MRRAAQVGLRGTAPDGSSADTSADTPRHRVHGSRRRRRADSRGLPCRCGRGGLARTSSEDSGGAGCGSVLVPKELAVQRGRRCTDHGRPRCCVASASTQVCAECSPVLLPFSQSFHEGKFCFVGFLYSCILPWDRQSRRTDLQSACFFIVGTAGSILFRITLLKYMEAPA